MNPQLLAAIRKLIIARRNAREAGDSISDQDAEAFIREETKGLPGRPHGYGLADAQKVLRSFDTRITPDNLGAAALQGATLNYADEIRGLFPGGDEAKERMRLQNTLFDEAHPVASAAGAITGGVAGSILGGTLVAGAAKALKLGKAASAVAKAAAESQDAPSFLRRLAKQVGIATTGGAATSAIAGSGAGTDRASRIAGAKQGAEVGAVIGVPLGAASATALPVARFVRKVGGKARGQARVASAIEESGGIPAVRQRVQDAVAAGRGKEVVLGDMSLPLQGVTDYAVNAHPSVRTKAEEIFRPRQANMTQRILNDTRATVGNPSAALRQEELAGARRDWANGPEGYGGIVASNPSFDLSAMRDQLDIPAIEKMYNFAREAGDITNTEKSETVLNRLLRGDKTVTPKERFDAGITVDAAGIHSPDMAGRPVTFSDLQDFQQALHDKAEAAFRAGRTNYGEAIKGVRQNLLATMEKTVPNYRAVSAAYKSRMDLERALQAGVDSFDVNDLQSFAKNFNALSPAEQAEFRNGLTSEFINKLQHTATNINTAGRIMQGSDATNKMLETIFGNDLPDFTNKVGWERNMASTAGALQGSATKRRLSEDAFDPADLLNKAHQGIVGTQRALFNYALGGFLKGNKFRAAQTAGDAVLTQGSDAIQKILDQMSAPPRANVLSNQGLFGTAAVAGQVPGNSGLFANGLFDPTQEEDQQ